LDRIMPYRYTADQGILNFTPRVRVKWEGPVA
jgi:hypothetical protein